MLKQVQHDDMYNKFKLQKGYIATSTVLVLMVVVLSITLTVSLLGIGETQGSQAQTKGEETLFLVEGCMESALLNAKNNNSYTGGNLTLPEGICLITVSKNGNIWTMTATNTTTNYVRTIRTVSTSSGQGMILTSWQEI